MQDCTPELLNQLSLARLLERSNLNAECLRAAREVFNMKYGDREFEPDLEGPVSVIDEREETIKIGTYIYIQNLFRNFGDLIQKFSIPYMFTGSEFYEKQIFRDVNEHLSGTLKALNLKGCKGSSLNGFTSTFNNVKLLTLTTYSVPPLESDRKLNEIFPNLNAFIIGVTQSSDWKIIGGNFANMTVLEVDMKEGLPNSNVTTFLKFNPQVKVLVVGRGNLTLLREVKEIYPQLDHLYLKYLPTSFSENNTETVHFNTLKQLTFVSDMGESPANIQFDNIQKLVLYVHFKVYNSWIDFMTNQVNPRITEIELAVLGLSKLQFLLVPETFAELERAKIIALSRLEADDIVAFIQKCKNLTNLKVICSMNEDEMERLSETLPEEWNAQFLSSGKNIEINLQKFDNLKNIAV